MRFHTHEGWWCGDKYAISSFRNFASEKYKSLEKLNIAWNTDFRDFEEINFPPLKTKKINLLDRRLWMDFAHWCLRYMPSFADYWIKIAWKYLSFVVEYDHHKTGFPLSKKQKNNHINRTHWLDFVH